MELNLSDITKGISILKGGSFSINTKQIGQTVGYLKNQNEALPPEVSQKILDFLHSPSAKDFQKIRENTKKMPFVGLGVMILGGIIYLINNQIGNIVLIVLLAAFVCYYFFTQNQKINGKLPSDIKNQILIDSVQNFLAKKIIFSNDQKFYNLNLENIISGLINYEKLVKTGSFQIDNIVGQKFYTQKNVTHTTTDPKTKETKTTTSLEKDKDFLLVSISRPGEYGYLTNPVNIFRNKNFFEKMFEANQVKLEDIRFENIFDVTGDQITSRQVLNQDFMEKLTSVSKDKNLVGLQFQNQIVHILYDISGKDFLSLSTFGGDAHQVNQIFSTISILKNIFDDKDILKI